MNNLSVSLLSQGKLKEVSVLRHCLSFHSDLFLFKGIEVLEKALKSSPASVVIAEPFLFNLCECASSSCGLG